MLYNSTSKQYLAEISMLIHNNNHTEFLQVFVIYWSWLATIHRTGLNMF